MDVSERSVGDRDRLDELIRATTNAKQRDRCRMVRLALDGEEKLRIAHLLGVAKSTVEIWVYRYRDGGLDALVPIKQPGAVRKLDPSQHERLRARLDAGATEADGACTLRGQEVRRILAKEFGVKMSLDTAYRTLHRLGYSCLSPRARHEHRDEQAQQHFREVTPFCPHAPTHRTRQARTHPRRLHRRSAVRTAGHADAAVGQAWLAPHGGEADQVRVDLSLRRGRACHRPEHRVAGAPRQHRDEWRCFCAGSARMSRPRTTPTMWRW